MPGIGADNGIIHADLQYPARGIEPGDNRIMEDDPGLEIQQGMVDQVVQGRFQGRVGPFEHKAFQVAAKGWLHDPFSRRSAEYDADALTDILQVGDHLYSGIIPVKGYREAPPGAKERFFFKVHMIILRLIRSGSPIRYFLHGP